MKVAVDTVRGGWRRCGYPGLRRVVEAVTLLLTTLGPARFLIFLVAHLQVVADPGVLIGGTQAHLKSA